MNENRYAKIRIEADGGSSWNCRIFLNDTNITNVLKRLEFVMDAGEPNTVNMTIVADDILIDAGVDLNHIKAEKTT